MGNYAKNSGIVISTITLKGEECKVITLGKLSDLTHGTITRVNPENIH